MLKTIDTNRLTDLHLDIRKGNLGLLRVSPMDTDVQETLQADIKSLVAEYLVKLNSPVEATVLVESNVEIVSESTRRYIETLETLLEEAANDTDDDDFAERIEKVLR